MPWNYSFTIKFHKEITEPFLPLLNNKITSNYCSFVQPDEEFEGSFPLTTGSEEKDRSRLGLGLLFIFTDQKWEPDTLYIQFKNDGFVGYYGETPTYETATSYLKSFCGLAIALRIFKVNSQYRSTPTKARFLIHRKIEENWEVQKSQDLDASTSDAFHDLVLHDLDRALDTDAKKSTWANSRLADIGSVFSHTDKTEKLLLATLVEAFYHTPAYIIANIPSRFLLPGNIEYYTLSVKNKWLTGHARLFLGKDGLVSPAQITYNYSTIDFTAANGSFVQHRSESFSYFVTGT